jgi:hypothetical protein
MDSVGRRLPRLLLAASFLLGASVFCASSVRADATPEFASGPLVRLLDVQMGQEVGEDLGALIAAPNSLAEVAAVPPGEVAPVGTGIPTTANFAADLTSFISGDSVDAGGRAGYASPSLGMTIYRYSAWSHQATNSWCVGAAVQMMINLITGGTSRGGADQYTYVSYAYYHSRYVARIGAEVDGWANALTHYGGGTYTVGAYGTFDEAIKVAATRMKITGKPVGLVSMEGHHAWVMAGFTSTGGDPSVSRDFTVTSVTVMAPFFGSIAYDPAPGAAVSMGYLSTRITPYTDDFRTIWDGKYVIIQP